MPLPQDPLEETKYDYPAVPFDQPDPEAIPPESSRPAPSSTTPGVYGDTPGEDGEPSVEVPGFNPRYKESFLGLLYVGALTASFDWMGHRFTIRTLRTGEVADIGPLTRPFLGTDANLKAMQCGIAAMAVVNVDGQEIPSLPLTRAERDTVLANRFDYVMKNWYPVTIDKVWEEYIKLEKQVNDIVQATEKASG